jgi:hypothetical protein
MATPNSTTKSVLSVLLPKKKSKPDGTAYTNTFQPTQTTSIIGIPQYRDHLTDIFTSRTSQDSRALLKDLFKFDSDVSAAFNAYLTVANTTPRFYVYNLNGELDLAGMKQLESLMSNMTKRLDYTTKNFSFVPSIRQLAENFRYMILLTGGCAGELIFNKLLQPSEIRQVDLTTVEWFETKPGLFIPQQRTAGAQNPISLDVPTFFVKYYRQNPTEIYTYSPFVSSINTIASRQQVINDLYRIMQKTGYPRIEITVIEEILRKQAPADIRTNDALLATWMNTKLAEIGAGISNMRPDSSFVHTDSIESKILNEKGPGSAFDVKSIIDVLNAQNQAALKTMATVIGRGESGVNTASVEARIFSLSADSLNGPVADIFSDMFSLALQLSGYQGYVECKFDKVELRPDTELEPQLTMKQARLLENLSLGLIDDNFYHIEMFGTPPHDAAPILSGTGFMSKVSSDTQSSASKVSPNSDPLGRSLSAPGSKSASSNTVKTTKK